VGKATVTVNEYENTGRPKRWKLILMAGELMLLSFLMGVGYASGKRLPVLIFLFGVASTLIVFVWELDDFKWVSTTTVRTYELPREEEDDGSRIRESVSEDME
jgi:hypothetical protein